MKRVAKIFTLNVACSIFLCCHDVVAQHQVKIMNWNILNFPNSSNTSADTATRCPAYRAVVQYVMPDVLVTQENTSVNSSPWFLNQVMNTGAYQYAAGTFINGYDTDNAIFYRDSLFQFVGNFPIQTTLRDINEYTLIYKPTGDTLIIYSLHLKAGLGDEARRALEVAELRSVTNALPPGKNFLVAGDFNIYESAEPAYQALRQDNPNDDGHVNDALNMTGVWNKPAYAPYHTQSTHYSSSGGFSGGGMNDRFDMILHSNGVAQPGGAYFVPGTYKNIGNDGNHYDEQINWGTNNSAPSNVITALYNASDHIPVVMEIQFGTSSGIQALAPASFRVDVFPANNGNEREVRINLNEQSKVNLMLTDAIGKRLFERLNIQMSKGENFVALNESLFSGNGLYILSVQVNNSLISKTILITN